MIVHNQHKMGWSERRMRDVVRWITYICSQKSLMPYHHLLSSLASSPLTHSGLLLPSAFRTLVYFSWYGRALSECDTKQHHYRDVISSLARSIPIITPLPAKYFDRSCFHRTGSLTPPKSHPVAVSKRFLGFFLSPTTLSLLSSSTRVFCASFSHSPSGCQ